MNYTNEIVQVSLRPEVPKEVWSAFNNYVNRPDLKNIYRKTGDSTYSCTILALGDLVEMAEIRLDCITVTQHGDEIHDLYSLIFESEHPYNEIFEGFSAKDWQTVYKALLSYDHNDVASEDLQTLATEVNKLF